MTEITVRDMDGKEVGTTELAEDVFGIAPNVHVMHEVVRSQLAARRAGTHDSKTRGLVSGGGKKPYRQKGTGRARQGTTRAPQYKGGGAVFGPHPRGYAFKVNSKEVLLAMRSALSSKAAEGALLVVNEFDFEAPSTKKAAAVLSALEAKGRVTIVLPDNDVNTFLSFRNIPTVRAIGVSESNTHDFLDNGTLIFTSASIQRIEEVLNR